MALLIKNIKFSTNENERIQILMNNLEKIQKQHLDMLLSFDSESQNQNLFNLVLDIYNKQNTILDASTYSLIIRHLCQFSRFDEAFYYLEKLENNKLQVKNRMIAPFFEHNNNSEILDSLFNKYNNIMLEQEFYYFLKKTQSPQKFLVDIIQIWSIKDQIITNQELFSLLLSICLSLPGRTIITDDTNTNSNSNNNCMHMCICCNTKFQKHTLTDSERTHLKNQLKEAHPESIKNLNKFEEWILKISVDYDFSKIYILDGGNIGHSNSGNFSLQPIIKMIDKLDTNVIDKPFLIILILHQRHMKKYKKDVSEIVSRKGLGHKVILFNTPYNENDDLYWMLSSFLLTNSYVITNDLLRDHHVNKLDEVLFKRWKDNVLITYDSEELYYPSIYTIGTQINTLGGLGNSIGWHIPFQNKEKDIQWLCYNSKI
jgi:pentatricopeptide repeat protein